MSENFRKNVRIPEELAKKARKFIESKHPVEYVKSKSAGKKRDQIDKLVDDAKIFALGTAKGTAWLAAGGSQFLLTLARWLTADNVFLRKMETHFSKKNVKLNQDGKPKKMSLWIKNNPNVYAHILWLFGLTAVSFGGYWGAEYIPDAVKTVKQKYLDRKAEKKSVGTYRAFLNKIEPITPFLIADLIVKEGVHVDPQTGLHTPYLDSNDIPTIGFGSTVLNNGKKVTLKTKPITTEEAYELVKHHLEEETFFILYCYDVYSEYIDIESTQEALALSSIIYNSYSKLIEDKNNENNKNRFAELRKLYKDHGFNVSDNMVRQTFKKYPITNPTSFGKLWLNGASKEKIADALGGFLLEGGGIYWRRWLEAGLLTGDITPQMLLDCPLNGMYEFYRVMGGKRQAFFTGKANNRQVNKETFKAFKKWLENPVNVYGESLKHWKKISDYLPKKALDFCMNGKCEFNNKDYKKALISDDEKTIKTSSVEYDEKYQKAMALYSKKNYKKAAKQLEKMLEIYPDNALLHNDLAATYNKLGRYEDAIVLSREVLHRIMDKSQYAAAQYNAGFAYEKLGNLEQALVNYKLALKNGNTVVKKDIARIEKLMAKKKIAFYDAARNVSDLDYVEEKIYYDKMKKTGKSI